MSETELKPCPFCGSPGAYITWDVPEKTWHGAHCTGKDCDMHPYADGFDSKEQTFEAWNKRYDAPKIDPLQYLVTQAQELDMGYGKPVEKVEEKPWIESCGKPEIKASIDIKLRDGSIYKKTSVDEWDWTDENLSRDIIAYRLS